jgi:phosphoglycolate phosphatase
MKEKCILIFDFDGTIADTFSYYLSCLNILADKFNFKKIPSEDIAAFRDMGSREIINSLHIPAIRVPLIVWEARKLLKKGIRQILPVQGMKQALVALQALDVTLGIITSNSVRNVETFLKLNEIEVFDFTFSSLRLWEKAKTLKKLLALKDLNPNRVYYIGDETRDIEAAHKAEVKSVAVTWGYNSQRVLSLLNPDYIVTDPKMLIGLVSESSMKSGQGADTLKK